MSAPLVSAVLPVYNGSATIERALASVQAQDWPTLEVIVVDDGSSDDTAALVAARPGVRLIRQANAGHGAAKNAGIAAASGHYLAFLDADDAWHPQKTRRQVEWLERFPEHPFVVCRMRAVLAPGAAWPPHMHEAHWRADPPGFVPSALLARREAFATIGVFDASYRHGNDSDWFMRARDAGWPAPVLPEVLVDKHIHGDNLSHRTDEIQRELFRTLRASLRRRGGDLA